MGCRPETRRKQAMDPCLPFTLAVLSSHFPFPPSFTENDIDLRDPLAVLICLVDRFVLFSSLSLPLSFFLSFTAGPHPCCIVFHYSRPANSLRNLLFFLLLKLQAGVHIATSIHSFIHPVRSGRVESSIRITDPSPSILKLLCGCVGFSLRTHAVVITVATPCSRQEWRLDSPYDASASSSSHSQEAPLPRRHHHILQPAT